MVNMKKRMRDSHLSTKKSIQGQIKRVFVVCFAVILAAGILAGCGGSGGEFYTLREAYVNGWLSVEELQSIAYYYQGNEDESFVPIALNPEKLSAEAEESIKKTHLQEIKQDYPFANIKGVYIEEYFGTYGDCIAVYVRDDYRKIDVLVVPETEIGGIVFYNLTMPGLMIWRKK